MEKGRSGLRVAGVVVSVAILSIFSMGLGIRSVPSSSDDAVTVRADLVTIDYLKTFGKLERPAVVFLHDQHTEALEKKNKDCTTCHLSESNRLSPKFKRLKDNNKTEVMDIFHTQCIACHRETAANKEKKRTGFLRRLSQRRNNHPFFTTAHGYGQIPSLSSLKSPGQ